MIKIFENNGKDFSAYYAAENWVRDQGYVVGAMCSPYPTGFADAKEYDYVAKWRNMDERDIALLSGRIEREGKHGDYRNGSVIVTIYD